MQGDNGRKKSGGTGRVKTAVLKCNCVSEFQDKQYGKGMRLHRSGTRQEHDPMLCTVCYPIRARKRRNMYIKGVTTNSALGYMPVGTGDASQGRLS